MLLSSFSLSARDGWRWTRPESEIQSGFPKQVAGTQLLQPLPAASQVHTNVKLELGTGAGNRTQAQCGMRNILVYLQSTIRADGIFIGRPKCLLPTFLPPHPLLFLLRTP